jgi:hypothetical protein
MNDDFILVNDTWSEADGIACKHGETKGRLCLSCLMR